LEKAVQSDRLDIILSSQGIVVEPPGPVTSESAATSEQTGAGFAVNPLDRSLDRLLAAMGQLEDATPIFARTENLAGSKKSCDVLAAMQTEPSSSFLVILRRPS
jgi:hypothetical protein